MGLDGYSEVYRKVEEVIIFLKIAINSFKHQVLCIFIWNISDHQSSFMDIVSLEN